MITQAQLSVSNLIRRRLIFLQAVNRTRTALNFIVKKEAKKSNWPQTNKRPALQGTQRAVFHRIFSENLLVSKLLTSTCYEQTSSEIFGHDGHGKELMTFSLNTD